jgi:hypothetical protein
LAAVSAVLYFTISVPAAVIRCRWEFDRSQDVKRLVLGVGRARQLHPDQVILLRGVYDNLFCDSVMNYPFRLLNEDRVYLAPGSENVIAPHPELGRLADLTNFVLPADATRRAFDRGQLVVYAAGGDRLQNITALYGGLLGRQTDPFPRRIDSGNRLLDYLFGPTWYPVDEHHRWMPKLATVQMGGPSAPGEKLYLRGYCNPLQTVNGPLTVRVTVEEEALPPVRIQPGARNFEFDFPLPANTVGKDRLQVTVEVDRTFRAPGDGRDLGLAFGTFEVH